MSAMHKPIVVMQDVSYTYDTSSSFSVPAISGLSLEIGQGEWISIVGASGSGKSTLCRLINGQLPRLAGGHRQGNVWISDIDPADAQPGQLVTLLGSVGQDPDAELVVGTVEDEIAFGPENLRLSPAEIGKRINHLTTLLELTSVREHKIHQLSGGQRQRTALAAVLALEPKILLLDEPAASLDPAGRAEVLKMIQVWHQAGGTLITASARWDETVQSSERVMVMQDGRIAATGTPDEIYQQHNEWLKQLYIVPSSALSGADRHEEDPVCSSLSNIPTADTDAQDKQDLSCQATSSAPAAPIVEVKNLSYHYRGTTTPALNQVTMKLYAGEMVLLTGINGSGKTTLTRLLSGLLQPPRHTIYRDGCDSAKQSIDDRAQDTGYLFQHPDHQWVAATVWEECCFGLRSELRLKRRDPLPESYQRQVESMLKHIGLSDRKEDSPYSLSGGQKRLLAAAAQFLLERPLYILDEPGSAADYTTIHHLLQLCRYALNRNACVLIITHEPEWFTQDAHRMLTLYQGQLIKDVQLNM